MPTDSNRDHVISGNTGERPSQLFQSGRRQFRWGKQERDLVLSQLNASGRHFTALVSALEQISGNPRSACRRFARALGVKARRAQRTWTEQECQRLLKLLDLYPVPEIARLLRRSESSIWHRLRRLGANGKMGTDSFSIYTLAVALHVRPKRVQDWISRGWLKTRDLQTAVGHRSVIKAEDFCDFCRSHSREVAGNRLSRERLEFVYHFAFPPSHAELLPLRESKDQRIGFDERLRKAQQTGLDEALCKFDDDGGIE